MRNKELLIAFIETHRDKSFEWATWDCCQFVGQWIYELTGKDYRAGFSYSSEAQARELLGSSGGLIALVSSFLKPIHVSRAMKGDIVLANDASGAALGICLGVNSAHVGPKGLVYFPTEHSLAAWRAE